MSKYFLLHYLKNPKSCTELARRGTLSHFLASIVAKHQKTEGGPFGEFLFRKSLTMLEKTEKGDPLDFFNIHSVSKHQKIEEGTLWRFLSKYHSVE